MALALALLEVGSLFVVFCGVLLMSAQSTLNTWLDVAMVLAQSMIVTVCCALCLYYNDLYDLRIVRGLGEFVPRLLKSLLLAFILLATFHIVFPNQTVTGARFLLSLVIVAALLLSVRAVYYGVMSRHLLAEPVLILGTGPLARKITDEIEAAPHLRYSIVGLVDEGEERGIGASGPPPTQRYPIYESTDNVRKAIRELRPTRIIVALAERRGRLPVRELLSSSADGVVVEDGIEVFERITGKLAIESLSPSFLIFSRAFKKSMFQLAIRRAMNVTLAGLGLILAAPFMAIMAILVKIHSEGPVFFLQSRVGLRGRTFQLLKFRTMSVPFNEDRNSVWYRDDTPRVTPLGKWMRDWHVDELPQFINILRGDMDVVGPRPEMACNVNAMEKQIPYYSLRHTIRPGVTGWAQVKHYYSVSLKDVTEKVRYDLYYIKNMSVWLDLRILIDTVRIVFLGPKIRGTQKNRQVGLVDEISKP